MSNRTLRVNELVQRELSDILRKRYQAEAVNVTLAGVAVAPDLRDGTVFVAVTGSADEAEQKLRWLRSITQDLRFELGRRIVLKFIPHFVYKLDTSTARGNRILQLLDDIEQRETKPAEEPQKEEKE